MPTQESDSDVVSVLTAQHEQAKSVMKSVLSTQGPERRSAFDKLRCLLAAHEGAEESVLHPQASRDLGADDQVVTERLAEESEAGKAIAKLETMNPDSEEFSTDFAALQKSVIAHAEAEEHQELPAIVDDLDEDQRQKIVKALSEVPELAESGAGELKANGDSFAAMLQSSRDHFRAATSPGGAG